MGTSAWSDPKATRRACLDAVMRAVRFALDLRGIDPITGSAIPPEAMELLGRIAFEPGLLATGKPAWLIEADRVRLGNAKLEAKIAAMTAE